MPLENKVLYEFGDFRLDPGDRLLSRGGTPVSLTPKAFEVLLVLVQNGSRLTTKEELMHKVWPDSFVEDANLTVNISSLRKLLGEPSKGQQYIDTVPKNGYRFVMPVKEVNLEDLPPSVPTVGPVDEFRSPDLDVEARKEQKRAKTAPVYLGIFAAILFLAVFIALRHESHQWRSAAVEHVQPPRRLAILPFQNLREDAKNDDFLGFSLADAVITKLGYVNALTVRPSYLMKKYTNREVDIASAATDLNVDTFLTGTFLHEGNDLRIACQLIDVKKQDILWKGAFDLKYEKLLSVQDEVAPQIIRGLAVTLSPSQAERLKPDERINPLAYEYYLRGVDLYAKSEFVLAIKMLERSIELAPDYAPSWANLGKSYTASASFQFGGREQYRKAQAAFERALTLRPDQIDARIYMANMFTDTGRVEKAVPLLRDALKANPDNPELHWELGYAYRFAGMLKQSVSECERARALDPVVKINSSTLNSYLYMGEYDKFLESLPKGDDVALISFYRGFGEYYRNNTERAVQEFDHAYELDPSLFQAKIGKALSLGIRHQEQAAAELLHEVERKIRDRGVGDPEAKYKIAQAYATLEDKTSALRVLKESIEDGFFPYPYFVADPLLKSIRNDSKFSELVEVARQRHESFKSSFL